MTDARAVLHTLTTEPQTKAAIALSLDWYSKKGQPDTRRVEQAVLEARLGGSPIVSGDRGYALAQTSAELLACYRWLRVKCLAQLRTASAVKKAALRMQAEEAKPLAWDWAA
jgi:hypothetical protein